jgi:hypothetical protein
VRRTIIIGTAIAMLVGASAAFAAFNTYGAGYKFSPTKAGSAQSPVPMGLTQTLLASGTNGNHAAPLIDLKTTIYGVKANGKNFPTCSASKIAAMKSDSFCPSKALVAQGTVNSQLVARSAPKGGAAPCNPYLHVWNGGQGKVTFFFVIIPSKGYTCATLSTGSSAPYFGRVTQQGKNMVLDVSLPPDVSTQAGGLTGVYGALIKEVLKWNKLSTRVNGKTVGYLESVGCKSGKRPWSQQYTAVNYPSQPGGSKSTQTVTGSAKCS